MKKISINTSNFGYPMPIVLIGTEVQEKPNFMTAAWMTHVNLEPSMLAVCLSRDHFTSGGIRENKTFSVNFPYTSLAIKTDFCGMNSGKETDKSTLFTVFHGKLKNVPLIEECPLCVGCTVSNIYSVAGDMLLIGEVVEAYSEEKYLTQGSPDVKKMNLLIFTMPDNRYWSLGEYVGQAWEMGKTLPKEG